MWLSLICQFGNVLQPHSTAKFPPEKSFILNQCSVNCITFVNYNQHQTSYTVGICVSSLEQFWEGLLNDNLRDLLYFNTGVTPKIFQCVCGT